MPLMKGHSAEVVSSNIKELVKSGRKPKEAIAIALANKRKYQKMADGGMISDEDASDIENLPTGQDESGSYSDVALKSPPQRGEVGANNIYNESALKMSDGGFIDDTELSDPDPDMKPSMKPDDGGHGGPNNEQSQRSIDEIAKQGKFQEESIAGPRQQSMDMALAKALDNYDMGGLVEEDSDESTGNEPSENMDVDAPDGVEPDPSGISEAFMKEIADRKKKRAYR